MKKAILVRIGVDHSFGGWNAPADPTSRRFLYVPIPEKAGTRFHGGCRRGYRSIIPAIRQFAHDLAIDPVRDLGWPASLEDRSMHLDPDFEFLTYGDVGDRRGSHIREMDSGDLIVFYAGLRSIRPENRELIYALVGLFVVDEVVPASEVPPAQWEENAHTRKIKRGRSDIVVRAIRGQSGRFSRFLPIGEFRNRAYRVRLDILKAWGGLTVKDGYIQRSARPPRFLNPTRFIAWFQRQRTELLEMNNEPPSNPRVAIVLLRQPVRSSPNEMRSDPFWEFGSFGCTTCHSKNLMHLARINELQGIRMAFAQGGPSGIRLVKLTPPVSTITHPVCAEARWTPPMMPFRYDAAPLLIDNDGNTDFPLLKAEIEGARSPTFMGRFSSKFRSRRKPLPADVAQEMLRVFNDHEREADRRSFARTYVDAMP